MISALFEVLPLGALVVFFLFLVFFAQLDREHPIGDPSATLPGGGRSRSGADGRNVRVIRRPFDWERD